MGCWRWEGDANRSPRHPGNPRTNSLHTTLRFLHATCYVLRATAVESSCLLGMNCLTGHNTLQLYTLYPCVSSATHNCLDEHSGTLYLVPTRDSCHPTAWLDNSIPYNIPTREWQPRANVFIANHRVVSLKVIAV